MCGMDREDYLAPFRFIDKKKRIRLCNRYIRVGTMAMKFKSLLTEVACITVPIISKHEVFKMES